MEEIKMKTMRCPWCDWSKEFFQHDHPYKQYADPFHRRGKQMLWSHIYQKHRIEWQKIMDEKFQAKTVLANLEKDTFGWTNALQIENSEAWSELPELYFNISERENRVNGNIMCEV